MALNRYTTHLLWYKQSCTLDNLNYLICICSNCTRLTNVNLIENLKIFIWWTLIHRYRKLFLWTFSCSFDQNYVLLLRTLCANDWVLEPARRILSGWDLALRFHMAVESTGQIWVKSCLEILFYYHSPVCIIWDTYGVKWFKLDSFWPLKYHCWIELIWARFWN